MVPEPDSLGTAGQSSGGAAQQTAAARNRGARVLTHHDIVFIINVYLGPYFTAFDQNPCVHMLTFLSTATFNRGLHAEFCSTYHILCPSQIQ